MEIPNSRPNKTILKIPNEIILVIFNYLTSKDILNLKLTCFRFCNLVNKTILNNKIIYKIDQNNIDYFKKMLQKKYLNMDLRNYIFNQNIFKNRILTNKTLNSLLKNNISIIHLNSMRLKDEDLQNITSKNIKVVISNKLILKVVETACEQDKNLFLKIIQQI